MPCCFFSAFFLFNPNHPVAPLLSRIIRAHPSYLFPSDPRHISLVPSPHSSPISLKSTSKKLPRPTSPPFLHPLSSFWCVSVRRIHHTLCTSLYLCVSTSFSVSLPLSCLSFVLSIKLYQSHLLLPRAAAYTFTPPSVPKPVAYPCRLPGLYLHRFLYTFKIR